MSKIPTNLTGKVRYDNSRWDQYTMPDPIKLSLGQKVGRFFGKALAVTSNIAAPILAIAVPGAGVPLAMGAYGLGSVAGNLTSRAEAKDAARMQANIAEQSRQPITFPGLFESAGAAEAATDFMTPSVMVPQAEQTVMSRQANEMGRVQGFQF